MKLRILSAVIAMLIATIAISACGGGGGGGGGASSSSLVADWPANGNYTDAAPAALPPTP